VFKRVQTHSHRFGILPNRNGTVGPVLVKQLNPNPNLAFGPKFGTELSLVWWRGEEMREHGDEGVQSSVCHWTEPVERRFGWRGGVRRRAGRCRGGMQRSGGMYIKGEVQQAELVCRSGEDDAVMQPAAGMGHYLAAYSEQ
jgi:hypothetical protein